jgi:hypothetical protein
MNDETSNETTGTEEGRELLDRKVPPNTAVAIAAPDPLPHALKKACIPRPRPTPPVGSTAGVVAVGGINGRGGGGGGGWINGGAGGWVNRRGYGGAGAWVNR